MKVEIVCSSRELFGADRSALRLGEVLNCIGAEPTLVVPSHRPELGLSDAAKARGLSYVERNVAIASSRGAEGLGGLRRAARPSVRADLTILNSTAVVGVEGVGAKRLLVVREWLEPRSPKHRLLTLRHRVGLDAVVGISTGVLGQWNACMRGPRVQALIPDWLEAAHLPPVRPDAVTSRRGIVCLGRFNSWKGQQVLADAYEKAFARAPADERPGLRFVGAQPGTPFAAQADAIARQGEHIGWEVLPFVQDPSPYLDSAALLVLPSLHPEPFGMVLLEALSRGCKVLAFPGGGPDDLAPAFQPAMKLIARDVDSLAEGLLDWLKSGGRAQSTVEWASSLATVRAGWSTEAVVPPWRWLLERLS